MDLVTHLLVGAVLGTAWESSALGWLVTAFAVLPDADTVVWAFPKLRRFGLEHRGATHTLLFGVLASAVAGALFAWAGWSSFLAAFLAAFAGFASHVALDVLHWGAPLFAPWWPRRVEWTVHAGLRASAYASAGGLALLGAVALLAPAWSGEVAGALAAAIVLYFGLRAALRVEAGRSHPGRRILPTGHPLVWVVTADFCVGRPLARDGRRHRSFKRAADAPPVVAPPSTRMS